MCKQLVSLTIVVPCFNEEEILPISIPKFMGILKDLIKNELITESSKIIFNPNHG